MKNKKIAVLVGDLGLGGAEKQLIFYLKALKSLNYNIKVYFICDRGDTITAIDKLQIKYEFIFDNLKIFRLYKLYRRILNFDPNLIQIWHTFLTPYLIIKFLIKNIISIGSIRGDGIIEISKVNFFIKSLYSILPDYYLTNSINAKKNFTKKTRYRSDKIFCIKNHIEFKNVPTEKKNITNDIIIISNLLPIKRLFIFLHVIKSLKLKFPKINAIILGEGPERKNLENFINKNQISKNIKLVGKVDNVSEFLSKSKVGILTSRSEGFPNAVLEYMASGLPVISTNVGDVKDVVKDDFNGFVLDEKDLKENMVQKINYLLENESIRKEFGHNSFQIITNNFTEKIYLNNVKRFLNRVRQR